MTVWSTVFQTQSQMHTDSQLLCLSTLEPDFAQYAATKLRDVGATQPEGRWRLEFYGTPRDQGTQPWLEARQQK